MNAAVGAVIRVVIEVVVPTQRGVADVPQITLVKTASDEVTVCDEVIQTLVVTNTGTGPAHNTMVKEVLPPGSDHQQIGAGTTLPGPTC